MRFCPPGRESRIKSRNFRYVPERDLRHNIGIPPSLNCSFRVFGTVTFIPSEEKE